MDNQGVTRGKTARRPRGLVLGGLAIVVLVIGVLVLFGRGDDPSEPPGPPVIGVNRVAVRDDLFAPNAIEVPAGTTVTWEWEGEDDHNVVGEGFDSPEQETGRFAHTFSTPGSYDYRCTFHGSMRGTVLVTEPVAS